MSSSKDTEKKLNQNIDKASGIAQDNIDKASSFAQDEVSRLRAELDDLRRKAGPKMHEAENYLTSPCALGFYQGNQRDIFW